MYKTKMLDMSKDLDLDDPDYFVKIIPIAYLPNRVHLEITERYSGENLDPEKLVVANEILTMYDLMREAVVDWNLTDSNGDILPIPRTLSVEENRISCGNLPLAIIQYVFEKCMEDTGEIPPMKPSESEPPPSLGHLAEVKPNDSPRSMVAEFVDASPALSILTDIGMEEMAKQYAPKPQHSSRS